MCTGFGYWSQVYTSETCRPIHVISKQMVSPSSYMERQAVLVNLAHKSLDNSSLQFLLANVSFHWEVPS